ncbi:peptidase [Kribbella sandramycini]|uniref:Peptidase n=1 Tax=Kribbella sandramycini TaxID=60450 RepID=A0A7Y4NXV1_9ACTN|nr:peptidase [Kribbella sandramycini]MBB6568254.1 hypothetical protein [Kribbella sandramycini]NOL39153.1 peptidase [Kribbella sandramycini]
MRKFLVLAAAATAAATVGAGFTAPAVAQSTPSSPPPSVSGRDNPGPEFWEQQAKVVDVADAITAAHRALPGDSGYAGLVVDAATSSIKLYWQGPVPAAVTKAGLNSTGVKITADPTARYSFQQLLKATDRVIAQRKSIDGAEVVSSGPLNDGSGLRIGVRGGQAKAAAKAAIAAAAGGIAVTVVGEDPQTSVATPAASGFGTQSRWNQQAFGGARWRNDGGGGCSEGFSLGWEGDSAMATAAHCSGLGGGARNPENGSQYGWISNRYTNRDIEAIRPLNANDKGFFQASMWWGNTGGQELWPVRGLTGNHPGMVTCSSGAYSGSICGLRIVSNGTTHCYPDFCPTGMVDVRTDNGGPVWGPGDSGGPISIPIGSDVRAGGIISGSDKGGFPTYCVGEQNRSCASYGWYAPLDQWTGETGFVLRTR